MISWACVVGAAVIMLVRAVVAYTALLCFGYVVYELYIYFAVTRPYRKDHPE